MRDEHPHIDLASPSHPSDCARRSTTQQDGELRPSPTARHVMPVSRDLALLHKRGDPLSEDTNESAETRCVVAWEESGAHVLFFFKE